MSINRVLLSGKVSEAGRKTIYHEGILLTSKNGSQTFMPGIKDIDELSEVEKEFILPFDFDDCEVSENWYRTMPFFKLLVANPFEEQPVEIDCIIEGFRGDCSDPDEDDWFEYLSLPRRIVGKELVLEGCIGCRTFVQDDGSKTTENVVLIDDTTLTLTTKLPKPSLGPGPAYPEDIVEPGESDPSEDIPF